jgi:UDP-N-acetylglucosamine diphosphorylase / glucose-1-phosphate thymidylyltransferase / UDP-N-acetylgalactosamine diphosphorylase / glucosamine-1-phosphate N-acetyltransferase / galactosamine-1-phosphate N-acetyltransferase
MNRVDANLFFESESIVLDFDSIFNSFSRMSSFFEAFREFKILAEVPVGAFLENREKIYIGKGTKIEAGSFIRGPCYIAENSEIRQGAYIRGNVIAGKGCVIGHATEIKDSILLDEVHASHFAYIGNCIIGNRVNLGAGVKLANLRLDRKTVVVRWKGQKIDSGLHKLGAILGDDVQIGCNAVCSPGVLLGKGVKILPLQHVIGSILA